MMLRPHKHHSSNKVQSFTVSPRARAESHKGSLCGGVFEAIRTKIKWPFPQLWCCFCSIWEQQQQQKTPILLFFKMAERWDTIFFLLNPHNMVGPAEHRMKVHLFSLCKKILVSSANHYLLTLGSPGRDRVLQSAPSPLQSPGSIPEGTRLKCAENSQNQSTKRRGSTNGHDSGYQQPVFCIHA